MIAGFDDYAAFHAWCKKVGGRLYVRAKVGRSWKTVAFSELTNLDQYNQSGQWWKRGKRPSVAREAM